MKPVMEGLGVRQRALDMELPGLGANAANDSREISHRLRRGGQCIGWRCHGDVKPIQARL